MNLVAIGLLLGCLASAPHDGQHDFDFEIGTWKTHLQRRLKPLTGSTTVPSAAVSNRHSPTTAAKPGRSTGLPSTRVCRSVVERRLPDQVAEIRRMEVGDETFSDVAHESARRAGGMAAGDAGTCGEEFVREVEPRKRRHGFG